MDHASTLRLAVIGAGPVGLAFALHLRGLGVGGGPRVFDARTDDGAALADPRVLALSEGSRQVLEAVGAWPARHVTPIARIHVSQCAQGLAALPRVHLDASEAGLPALGYTVRYGALLGALEEAARAAAIDIARGRPMHARAAPDGARILEGAVAAMAEDAGEAFDLAVLAEGGAFHDQAPRALRRDYAQIALVGQARCEGLSRTTAIERFTPDGPVALLPCGTEHALVWCLPPARAQAVRSLGAEAQRAALQARLPASAGRVLALELHGGYPLGMNAGWRAREGRIVRLGNAAQTLHPVAGQGLNLGLRDAVELARALATVVGPNGVRHAGLDAALGRYARRRVPDRIGMLGLTDLLAQGFTIDLPGADVLRAGALGLLAACPPLRHALQRRMVFGWRG